MTDLENRLRELLDRRAEDAPVGAGLPRGVARRVGRRRTRNIIGVAIVATLVGAGILLPLKAMLPLADRGKIVPADGGYEGLPLDSPLMVAGPGEFYYEDVEIRLTCSDGRAVTYGLRTWVATEGSGRMVFDPPPATELCDVGFSVSLSKDGYGQERPADVTFEEGEHPVSLVDLSGDPVELLRQLEQRSSPSGASPGPEPLGEIGFLSGVTDDDLRLFRVFYEILGDRGALLPTPAVQAGLFQIGRGFPEVAVDPAAKDPIGRPAVSLTFPMKMDGEHPVYYFDPRTLQLLAGPVLLAGPELIVNHAGIVDSTREVPTVAHDLVAPSAAPAPVEGPADLAQVSCIDGRAQVTTPQVRAQSDGVRIEATSDGGSSWLEIQGDNLLLQGWGSEGAGTPGSGRGVELPPGDYSLRCLSGDTLHTERETIYLGLPGKQEGEARSHDPGAALTVVDPQGFFTPYLLECSGDSGLLHTYLGPASDGIPDLSLALPRTISGTRPDDVISQVGYPDTQGSQPGQVWQISRGGTTIGVFRAQVWSDGVVTVGDACTTAGLAEGADPTSPPATADEMPGYNHCSPYLDAACTPVWVSTTIVDRANGEDVQAGPDEDTSWCKEPGGFPCAPHPNDMARVVFMTQPDAERWFAEHDCGWTIRELCRPGGFTSGSATWGGDWYPAPGS